MTITLSDRAQTRIRTLLAKESEGSFLRLEIMGGGCSGLQYVFRIDHHKSPEDQSIDEAGTFVIDPQSSALIENSLVDFQEDLMGASFVVRNPNASSSCGCGSSFSI